MPKIAQSAVVTGSSNENRYTLLLHFRYGKHDDP